MRGYNRATSHVTAAPNHDFALTQAELTEGKRSTVGDCHGYSRHDLAIDDMHWIYDRNAILDVIRLVQCTSEWPGAEGCMFAE